MFDKTKKDFKNLENLFMNVTSSPLFKFVFKSYYVRTVLTAALSLGMNSMNVVLNLYLCFFNSSSWFGTLAAYYSMLSLMRFEIIQYEKKLYKDRKYKRSDEIAIYRKSGILLVVFTIALTSVAAVFANNKGGAHYSGSKIYLVGAYTLYKIINAVYQLVKATKMHSLTLIAIRNINYTDALVSMLSLQTALFASFGRSAVGYKTVINSITSLIVCTSVLGIGIHMIHSSYKLEKEVLHR